MGIYQISLVSPMIGAYESEVRVKSPEEILKLATEESREIRILFSELEESVNRLCRTTVLPRAKLLLLSLVRRYKKQMKISNWYLLETSLPEVPRSEFVNVIKELLPLNLHSNYDPSMTWEALESLIFYHISEAMHLFLFLKTKMQKGKYPFSF
jgi:hypothetical protein